MTPGIAVLLLALAFVGGFLIGQSFGRTTLTADLLAKHARWTDELGSETDAAFRLVRWLRWFAMPAKWFDGPEEP